MVIAFLSRSKCLLFSWLQSPSVILEPKKIKSVTVSIVSPKSYDQPRQHIKKQRPTKVCLVKAMVFPVGVYGCEKESWVPKNWCFLKTLESSLDCKEIQPVSPKGSQSWIFIGRTDAEAEALILSLPDAKNWLIGKDPDAGKDWRQEEKGMTENEMVGWHHWLDGHGFGWTLGVGDGQGGLVCYSPWGRKESDMTEQQNWPTNRSLVAATTVGAGWVAHRHGVMARLG